MRKHTAGGLAAVLVATTVALVGLALATARPAAAEHVVPTMVGGNPSCPAGLIELKIEPVADGTYSDGTLTVTIDERSTSLGEVFDWTSNIGVDLVIAKGGPNANLYAYSPEATSDTGLHAPEGSSGLYSDLSHISFCYDLNLEVSKTAVTTFNRDFDWTIDKSADQTELTLASGETATVNYTVVVDKDAGTDSGWAVSGTISVHNPAPFPVTGVAVTDTISGLGAVAVDCGGVTTIAPGGTLNCTYSSPLPNADSRTNTAQATASNLAGGSGTAAVTFGNPTNVADDCVDVSDSRFPALGGTNVCADATFNYALLVVADDLDCGLNEIDNTASLDSDDGVVETDSWQLDVTVECADLFEGCTPGYWKNHLDSWGPTGYSPNDSLSSVFAGAPTGTLLQALSFGGGSTLAGAKQILLRAAVAALLNAAHPDVDYPMSTADIISQVSAALASNNRGTILSLASQLDTLNNLGCPIS